MVSYNKVILIGNLTKDPEIRYTPSGTPVTSFRLAVNHRYKQGEELKEEVCFIDVVVFGKQAEACGQYLGKGSSVIVDGRLQERRWETEDGQKRSKHEVVAQTVRPALLAQYERIRRGRARMALYPLHGDACGHCYTAVPMHRRRSIQDGQSVVTCEACGVMIYSSGG